MKSRRSLLPLVLAGSVALVTGAIACSEAVPTNAGLEEHESHGTTLEALYQNETRKEVREQIKELARMTARYHNVTHAIEDGYDASLGCIDETIAGVDPAVARGMGYHVTKSSGIIQDDVVNFLEPELLVYAPHPRDAELPPEQRVRKAKLIAVEYFVAGSPDDANPPELFGETFDYSATFGAWVRHIYLWGDNPEGIYENYNGAVPLCTQLLGGEPIG